MAHLKHPDSSQVIEVSPAQVQLYLSQGWEKHRPKSSASTKATPTATVATKKE